MVICNLGTCMYIQGGTLCVRNYLVLLCLNFWSIRKGFVHLWTSEHSAFILCWALRSCRGHCRLYESIKVKLNLMYIHGLSLQFLTCLASSIDVLYTHHTLPCESKATTSTLSLPLQIHFSPFSPTTSINPPFPSPQIHSPSLSP
jgi:hypothetical protein